MQIVHKIFITILLLTFNTLTPFTIMIDPSGDAKHTGRIIQDTFERGITLQCAELLKKELNNALPNVRVVLTRVPGETIQPLQNASFANRLQVDFYLSIYFYEEKDIPAHLALYQYVTSNTDYWHTYNPLSFYHMYQAHLININASKAIGETFVKTLQDKIINPHFAVQGLFAVPFKPLLGIKAPALALEAGISDKISFKKLISPLIACIKEITS